MRLVNELPEPTTIHWHGVRLPNSMDGVPHLTQAPVVPGASFDYRFRAPDAGTFCYYAPGQEDRGLYGALIVEEGQAVDVDREIVLALGVPGEPSGASRSLLVNGSVRPNIPVKAGESVAAAAARSPAWPAAAGRPAGSTRCSPTPACATSPGGPSASRTGTRAR